MKVRELIDILSEADSNSDVILSQDSEGNSYSPVAEADLEAVYISESNSYGDVYSLNWTAEDACMTDKDWKDITNREKCVVLFPTR